MRNQGPVTNLYVLNQLRIPMASFALFITTQYTHIW